MGDDEEKDTEERTSKPPSTVWAWLDRLWNWLNREYALRRAEETRLKGTFGDPVLLAKYYIEQDCLRTDPNETDDSSERQPIQQEINRFITREIVSGMGPRIMLVVADAGMGKTSLLLRLHWRHFLEQLPGTRFRTKLLKLGQERLDEIAAIKDAPNHILLLDSLDEDPAAHEDIAQRLNEVLAASEEFHRVILTCRTQYLPETKSVSDERPELVNFGRFNCLRYFVCTFTDEQVEAYIRKRYSDEAERKQCRKLVANAADMKARPMLLAYSGDLLGETSTQWNAYTIHKEMIRSWLQRETEKPEHPAYEDLRAASLKAALRMHQGGVGALSAEEIKADAELAVLKDLKITGRSLLLRHSDGSMRFAHKTFMEALVVEHFLATGRLTVIDILSDQMQQFLQLQFKHWPKELRVDLRKVFARPTLQHADLQYADLQYANLQGSHLKGANLQNANLKGANLQGAHLKGAHLQNADLKRAHLQGADLQGADLQGANLHRADLHRADLRDTNLHRANLRDTKLEGADLQYANLRNTKLEGAKLEGAKLQGANLLGANLLGAIGISH